MTLEEVFERRARDMQIVTVVLLLWHIYSLFMNLDFETTSTIICQVIQWIMVGASAIILGFSFKPGKLYFTHCAYWVLAIRAIIRLYNFEWDIFSLNRDDYKASIHIAFCVFLV